MDQEISTPFDESLSPAPEETLPAVAANAPPATSAPEPPRGIFGRLVGGDDDLVGLVAYSLYKQNKIDWMRAFEKAHGRAPGEPEFSVYALGENTERRVATYRFLAEATIDRVSRKAQGAFRREHPALSATLNVFYGLVGVASVAALIVLLRFFISLKH